MGDFCPSHNMYLTFKDILKSCSCNLIIVNDAEFNLAFLRNSRNSEEFWCHLQKSDRKSKKKPYNQSPLLHFFQLFQPKLCRWHQNSSSIQPEFWSENQLASLKDICNIQKYNAKKYCFKKHHAHAIFFL